MVREYKVITLCGSTRFKDAFLEVQKRLTLEGNIVISVGLFGHSGDEEVWEGMDEGTLTRTKEMLDDMHKAKIDLADEIFVINVGGYIGDSTRSEIAYAKKTGKAVRYLETLAEDDDQTDIGRKTSEQSGKNADEEKLKREKKRGGGAKRDPVQRRIFSDRLREMAIRYYEIEMDTPPTPDGMSMERANSLLGGTKYPTGKEIAAFAEIYHVSEAYLRGRDNTEPDWFGAEELDW